ncbi:hypothetical protein BOTBODRAFT_103013 [Botryobasidium botryosum FD-172 SS1]|uniref:L-serine ammonia-lyase n=1 Tax=Botryobasidium botryosum (strain FD-172 SS1) TaxID=930990 RepID=A0A067MTW4_BOTB1|nr:hypothetical protein BOTBODRAFT_103013 [Botryobasidium botryosum FD-172 SS1]
MLSAAATARRLVFKSRWRPSVTASSSVLRVAPGNTIASARLPSYPTRLQHTAALLADEKVPESIDPLDRPLAEHAVISAFDLFSIGVGPSSSHTVGPMRAAKIFVVDLQKHDLLEKVHTVKVTLYGSLAATGKGHMTPQAIVMGLEGSDPETIDTGTLPSRYQAIIDTKHLTLGGSHRITYDMDKDMLWRWDQTLPTHPNGMRFSCFGENGDLIATNEFFSVGGGFVVNEATKVDENLYYKNVDKEQVDAARLSQTHGAEEPSDTSPLDSVFGDSASESAPRGNQPPYLFHSGDSLIAMTKAHNLTIAQLVYENERHYLTPDQIHDKLMRIWGVMDDCIRTGVATTETTLPGRLNLKRRAPMLYKRLMRGFYPSIAAAAQPLVRPPDLESGLDIPLSTQMAIDSGLLTPNKPLVLQSSRSSSRVVGSFNHAVPPMAPRKTVFPGMDFLSCYAIAVNEVNAGGGRIVTSPTNGASGVIPAVLKYIVEFSSHSNDAVSVDSLTAAAIGMLFKRGSTISAAEGCQAEVGVACSMAGFAACMGASPEIIAQSAEIGIEHNLGLTCDPIDGLVQVPCIVTLECNAHILTPLFTAAQLAMASGGVFSVTLDEAIEAMRLTAKDMSVKYKETSLSGLATTVRIPLSSPAW